MIHKIGSRSLFDPGHPEVVGCTEGVARFTALIMWYVYNLITVTILLNLLIAVMNASMSRVQANTIEAWKFQRTQVRLLRRKYCVNAHTKNTNFDIVWKALEWKSSIYFMVFWYI
jgi:hypothetical protein